MNTVLITPKDKQKSTKGLIESIILLILGIVLVTNSNSIVTITFQIIGALTIVIGIYRIMRYMNLKKQFKTEDTESLTSGIIIIAVGLLIILLASILEVGLRYIIGIYLIWSGINKTIIASTLKNYDQKLFTIRMITGIIYITLGLYTILIANAALIIIGILLIISSLFDIIACLKNKKK